MKEKGHNFKKKFGQNFLIEKNIITKIVNSAEIEENSLIIEIGPGSGNLTKLLGTKGTVIAYEIDSELKGVLDKLADENQNIKIIYDDFLKRNVKEEIRKYKYNKIYVIANLPYYITTPIITKLIEEGIDIEKIVIMVQKEVGERFSAQPNSREYSSITVFLNYYFDIKKLFIVSRNCFFPKPNVDSLIVTFTKKEQRETADNEETFFKLVRNSFTQKRKTIKNNLRDYDLAKVEEILLKHNMSLQTRAEEIPLEVFIEISNNL